MTRGTRIALAAALVVALVGAFTLPASAAPGPAPQYLLDQLNACQAELAADQAAVKAMTAWDTALLDDLVWAQHCVDNAQRALAPYAPAPTPTPTATSSSTPTPPATTTAPATTPPSSSTPTPTSGPRVPPSASNTGVPAGHAPLVKVTGNLVIRTDGTVIDGQEITGGIEVYADNVTIRNTRVDCTGGQDFCIYLRPGSTGDLVTDTEAGGPGCGIAIAGGGNAGAPASTIVMRRLNLHSCDDGGRIDGGLTLDASYVHGLNLADGAHGDGLQSTGWPNMVLSNNWIEGGATSAVFLKQESGNPAISNVSVTGNWLIGAFRDANYWSTAEMFNVSATGVSVTNNLFKRWPAGTVQAGSGSFATWSGNVWLDDGTPVAKP